jgi:hypothetical protein
VRVVKNAIRRTDTIVQGPPKTLGSAEVWIAGAFASSSNDSWMVLSYDAELKEAGHTLQAAVAKRLARAEDPTPKIIAVGSVAASSATGSAKVLTSDNLYWAEVEADKLGNITLSKVAGGTSRLDLCCSAIDPQSGTLWVGGVLRGAVELAPGISTNFDRKPRTVVVAYDAGGKPSRALELDVALAVSDNDTPPVELRALAFDAERRQLVLAIAVDGALALKDLFAGSSLPLDGSAPATDKGRVDVLWLPVDVALAPATLVGGRVLRGGLRLAARAGKAALAGLVEDPLDTSPLPTDQIGVLLVDSSAKTTVGPAIHGVAKVDDELAAIAFLDDLRVLVASNADLGAAPPGVVEVQGCPPTKLGTGREGLLATLSLTGASPNCIEVRPTAGPGDERLDSVQVYRASAGATPRSVALAGRHEGATSIFGKPLSQAKHGAFVALLDVATGELSWVRELRGDAELSAPLRLSFGLRNGDKPDLRLGIVHPGALTLGSQSTVAPSGFAASLTLARYGLNQGALIWQTSMPLEQGGELRGLEVAQRETIVVSTIIRGVVLSDGDSIPAGEEPASLIVRFGPEP